VVLQESNAGVDAEGSTPVWSNESEMLRDLYVGGTLAGVKRQLKRRFSQRLDDAQLNDCVAEGVSALYGELQKGTRFAQPAGYLFKVALHTATDLVDSYEYRHKADVDVEALAESPWAPQEHGSSAREDAKAQALYLARSYLPRLGQENIQRVMTVLIDAIEADVPDLPHAKIAEATGLSVDTTRRLVNRALERLYRLAKEDGHHIDKYLIDDYAPIASCDAQDESNTPDDANFFEED